MKLQQLNEQEMKDVNGGLLGLGNSNDSSSTGGLMGSLGIHFSNQSMDDDGSWEKTEFGSNLDLGGILNSITN